MAHIKRIPNLNANNPLHRKAEHKPKVEAPVTRGARAAAASTEPRLDIRLYRRRNDNTFYFVVQMYSRAQPNYLVEAPLEVTRKSLSDLDFEIGVLCGAMAERLNELYGDDLEPEKAARFGSKQMADVIHAYEHRSEKVPERTEESLTEDRGSVTGISLKAIDK